MNFYSVNKIFDISMRETNSVCQDDNGFIWVSSKFGILRLTNDDHRIYTIPYESANVITVKLVYENSQLIAYTNNGQIFIYDPVYDKFELFFNLSNALNNNYLLLQKVLMDNTGAYWFGSSVGLFRYKSGNLKFISEMTYDRYSMTWFDAQHIVIAKTDGIWLFDVTTEEFEQVYENTEISPFAVSELYYDKGKNRLLLGTFSNGLYLYQFDKGFFTKLLNSTFPEQPIQAIEANTDSTWLVGIDGQGIWELDDKCERVLNIYKEEADDVYSLIGNGVYDLFADDYNRIWVCTYSGGASYFEQATTLVNQVVHQTNNSNSLVNNDVNCLIEDQFGKIWFATNNGISCWDVRADQWKSYYTNAQDRSQVFLSLCEDDQGRIWASTYSSGVYLIDARTGKELAHYSHDQEDMPRVSNFVIDIYKDSSGDIWLGGIEGEIIRYESETGEFRAYSNEPVQSLSELSDNQIILGCSYGLSFLDKETGRVSQELVGFLINDVIVVDDIIWICTSGDGLIRFDYKNDKTEKFTTESGLTSNYINSIVYSGGYFWLGTENGLCRFNPNDNRVSTFPSLFPLSTGISYNNGAVVVLNNGELAWGTNNGAVIYDPDLIQGNRIEGRIFIQDISISGRSVREIPEMELSSPIDSIESLRLTYTQKNLSLELLPINTLYGTKFSWKMEGFDDEWSTPSENRILTYTNLPSGDFELLLRLYDSSLSQVIAERSLSIFLVPPFWQRVWFFTLVGLVVVGLIFLYFIFYINRLKQIHTEEKVRFFTNTAHDIRTSLTLIKGPVEELGRETRLSDLGKKYLNLARDQVNRLSFVVTQLMDFQKVDVGKEHLSLIMVDIVELVRKRISMFESLAKSMKIELAFTSDEKKFVTAVDELKIERVIDNLISNAIKYSYPNNKVFIDLKRESSKWVLSVKDNGIGIDKKAQRKLFKEFYRSDNAINAKIVGSGIGLLLAKSLVTLHGGNIHCTSQKDVGSTFQISIPVKTISKTKRTKAKDVNGGSNLRDNFVKKKIEPKIVWDEEEPTDIKILVVEDNGDLLGFIEDALSVDFDVVTAINGEQAWNYISNQIPDLVVTDIMMPRMDGFELCELIKSTYETSHIPVIMLTALNERVQQLRGLGLGADDYITKPFDISLLIQRIKTIIRNRETIRDNAIRLMKENPEDLIFVNELNDTFMKKMLDVAKSNISNALFNKNEFASEMNVSPSLLYKKVKSLTGQSPTDFIKIIRLNYAMELLKSNQHTITEISELSGFSSAGYFSTVFKKHFGKAPTEISHDDEI